MTHLVFRLGVVPGLRSVRKGVRSVRPGGVSVLTHLSPRLGFVLWDALRPVSVRSVRLVCFVLWGMLRPVGGTLRPTERFDF